MEGNILSIFEYQIKDFVLSIRPPEEIRDKLDIGYSFEHNVFELFEIRPMWDNPKEKIQSPIAKARFIKSKRIWKIYWMRANLTWHLYEPNPEAAELKTVLKIIKEDEYHCFWG